MIGILIDSDYIEKCKKNYPTFSPYFDHTGTRWIGKVGEEAIRIWFNNEKIKYKDLTNAGASWIDFIVGSYKMDVKCLLSKHKPLNSYAGDIIPSQLEKSYGVNTYIFTRLVEKERTVYICGLISKERFMKEKTERLPGVQITPTFKSKEKLYEIPIYKMTSPEQAIKVLYKYT